MQTNLSLLAAQRSSLYSDIGDEEIAEALCRCRKQESLALSGVHLLNIRAPPSTRYRRIILAHSTSLMIIREHKLVGLSAIKIYRLMLSPSVGHSGLIVLWNFSLLALCPLQKAKGA